MEKNSIQSISKLCCFKITLDKEREGLIELKSFQDIEMTW